VAKDHVTNVDVIITYFILNFLRSSWCSRECPVVEK